MTLNPCRAPSTTGATGSAGSPLAGIGRPAAGTQARAQEFRFRSLGAMGQRVLTLLVGTG